MLKKTITYEDFNGAVRTEDFYFNFSRNEVIRMEVREREGFAKMLVDVVNSDDREKIYSTFENFVLMAYGEKSPDGRQFMKSQEIRDRFAHTNAFDELVVEMFRDANFAAEFVNGVMPKNLDSLISEDAKQADPSKEATVTELPTKPQDMTKEELLQMFHEKAGGRHALDE